MAWVGWYEVQPILNLVSYATHIPTQLILLSSDNCIITIVSSSIIRKHERYRNRIFVWQSKGDPMPIFAHFGLTQHSSIWVREGYIGRQSGRILDSGGREGNMW